MIEQGTSVSVLCMDKYDVLRLTLDALHKTLVQPYEVILVDNGSTDPKTCMMLEDYKSKGWRLITNAVNMGLSVGVNQGLFEGRYDTLIHLDDDCMLYHQGWNQIMRNYLISHAKVGLVVPGSGREFIKRNNYKEIRWGLGFCWAIRKSLYDDIGGYDPQLLHQNECDLALRVRMAGYHVAGIDEFNAIHNDPGGQRSEVSLAREHLGVVQFRDKWTQYFRGKDWNYGTIPLYLMQHWPPDQEWYREYALQNGIDLNPPCPPDVDTSPGAVLGLTAETAARVGPRRFKIGHGFYMAYVDVRNDYGYWEKGDGYLLDRQKAIDTWFRLTGKKYEGYKWPNLLKP